MSSPRERLLAEGIKNKLIAIQKAEQFSKELSKWKTKVLAMNKKEIENAANLIAAKVTIFAASIERKNGAPPTPDQIMNKIKEELDKI